MIRVELSLLDKCVLPLDEERIYKATLQIANNLLAMDEICRISPIFKHDFSDLNFELSFCNDSTIHQINREYRQKDSATDVITFALFVDDTNSIVINDTVELGEIIISTDTLLKQAKENNVGADTELYTLITHGILHLLGFDHLNQKDYDFVVGIQNKVIESL